MALTDQHSGILLGVSSIVLFFLSLGFGFRKKARITTVLLIAAGAVLTVSRSLNLYLVIVLPYFYISLIATGFILIGLGVLRAVMGP